MAINDSINSCLLLVKASSFYENFLLTANECILMLIKNDKPLIQIH